MAVTCSQFVAALVAAPRNAVLSAELQAHGARCARCFSMWQADELLRQAPAPELAVSLPQELQQALREHRGTTRTSSPKLRALAVSSACAVCLLAALLFFPRPDLQSAFQSRVLPPFVALLALMAASLVPFLSRGRTGLGLQPSLRWLGVFLSFATFQVLCALVAGAGAEALHTSIPLPTPRDCLALGLVTASCIFAATFAVSRHSALIAPRASGALAGASAGFGALLFLQLHCPSQIALHLHIVHALPLAMSIGLGAMLGRRWLSV